MSLEPVVGIRPVLQYDLQHVPGATSLPFVARPVLKQLRHAAEFIADTAREGVMELVLWDAHHTREVQHWIVERAIPDLRARYPSLSEEQVWGLAGELLGDPHDVFPHGTGGAVAVTLAVNGRIVDMGSAFGDLTERSRRDFFTKHPPETEAERSAMGYRETLHSAMTEANFWGHAELWWHYEMGTRRWALESSSTTTRDPQLTRVLSAPTVEGPAARPPIVPSRYSSWRAGVGHPFLDVQEGIEARSKREESEEWRGHYYARVSHPGGDALAEFLAREIFHAERVALSVSGHAASAHAVRALTAKRISSTSRSGRSNGHPELPKLVVTDDIYHGSMETFRKWCYTRSQNEWLDLVEVKSNKLLDELDHTVDVVYVDSPSNWHLNCHDLHELAQAVHKLGAALIVDVTLQPCQGALEAGADLIVCSLSKDISLGHTMAGAIAGLDATAIARIASSMVETGEMVTAETAHTIHQHAFSLRDRLHAQAVKVARLEQFLEGHESVANVKTADPRLCGGLTGSQLTFELLKCAQGRQLERVVGQRSLDPTACLHLARTFGAVFTSLEHLASRYETADGRLLVNLPLPRGTVRLGLGCEDWERIVAELEFALDASSIVPEQPTVGLDL
jgi:zinc D-Ala-D-Ala dipeptidase